MSTMVPYQAGALATSHTPMVVSPAHALASELTHQAFHAAINNLSKVAKGFGGKSSTKRIYQTKDVPRGTKRGPGRPQGSKNKKPPKKTAAGQRKIRDRRVGFHPHRHNFRSDIVKRFSPKLQIAKYVRPLKPYQKAELRFYPHPIVQKMIHGDWEMIPNTDNVVREKIDYTTLDTPLNKDVLGLAFHQISGPSKYSGTQTFDFDNSSNNNSFNKYQMIGTQNKADEKQSTSSSTDGIDCILKKTNCRMELQSTRNFPVLVQVSLVRLKNPGSLNLSQDEKTYLFNSMSHTEYDEAKILCSQTKVLPPCSANKIISQTFDLTFDGYYKYTNEFSDASPVTTEGDIAAAGGALVFGRQARDHVQPEQGQEANRLFWIIKYKRMGNTTVGKAFQSKEWTSGTVQKQVGIEYNVNIEDGETLHDTVSGTTNDDNAVNEYTEEDMTLPSARVKVQFQHVWRVKEAVRNVSTLTSGKTNVVYGSRHNPNYATQSSENITT